MKYRPCRRDIVLFLGVLTLLIHSVVVTPLVTEDAYITYRFAANVARGEGPTFNAGENAYEGFSSMLWVLMLAVAFQLVPDMVTVSLVLGVALQTVALVLLCFAAWRLGAGAWLAVLFFATNSYLVRNSSTGMETALAMLLTTCIACAWISEGSELDGDPLRTSLWCWLLSLARAEGASIFLAISCFRVYSYWKFRERLWINRWFSPFLGLTAIVTVAKVAVFGSIVPSIYYSRILAARGALFDRLIPGLEYVWWSLLANPVVLLGLVGFAVVWRDRRAQRIAVVSFSHLFVVILAGGDAHYIGFSRFIVPISGCVALLLQLEYQALTSFRPETRSPRPFDKLRRGASAAPTLALDRLDPNGSSGVSGWELTKKFSPIVVGSVLCVTVVAGNSMEVVFPGRHWRPHVTPLAAAVSKGPQGLARSVEGGIDHFRNGLADASRRSFYGRVARHLSLTLPWDGELGCSQAGQIAYIWPGRFRDLDGLATRPPFDREGLRGSGFRPRWYLLGSSEFRDLGKWLIGRFDYTVERVYLLVDRARPGEWRELILLEDLFQPTAKPATERGGRKRTEWKELPESRVVLFSGTGETGPVYDGVRGRVHDGQVSTLDRASLHQAVQNWAVIERIVSAPTKR